MPGTAAATFVLHRVALGRVLPILGNRRLDELTVDDVNALVVELAGIRHATSAFGYHTRVRLRASTTKTRAALWVELPDALAAAIEATLPPRDDRDFAAPLLPGVTADRLRTSLRTRTRTS